MVKKETSTRGSCSVYLDLAKKHLVDVTGPLYSKNLSQVIDDALTAYLQEYAPLELLDMEITRLEEQLAILKAERANFGVNDRISEVIKATAQQQAQEVRAQKESLDAMRGDRLKNPEKLKSLAYQIKHKTIDWTLIKSRFEYESAIEAREDILTRLLALGKIEDKDCSGV